MPRPACAPTVLWAPLFLESVYEKKKKYRFKQFGSVRPDLGLHCLQKKDRDDAPPPPHPSDAGDPWNCTHGTSQGVQFHLQLPYLCLKHVCVGGGGGGEGTSDFFQSKL